MVSFIIIAVLIGGVAVFVTIGLLRQRRDAKSKRQAMLSELEPWVSELEKMDAEQLDQEYRRIRQLWLAAKDEAEKLYLQLDLVCQETSRRFKLLKPQNLVARLRKPSRFGRKNSSGEF